MIYLDNAATSYPKPFSVLRQAWVASRYFSFNSGRGGYRASLRAAEKIYGVRCQIGQLFGFPPERVIFTKNCTEALNTAIKGIVKPGGHVIISSLEHNSVSRVVKALQDKGVADFDIAPYDADERVCVAHFQALIKRNTCAVVCMHASNVFGVVFPIAAIGALCRKRRISFIVDAAQSAGCLSLNAEKDNIDVLCAPGHKGLMGPMGTGFLAVREGVTLRPLTHGGTGSASLKLQQPTDLPEGLESGTLNNAGILALGKGLQYLEAHSAEQLYHHEMQLCQGVYDALNAMPSVTLYTDRPTEGRFVPLLSLNIKNHSGEAVAAYLAEHNICVRGGYHCAGLAHRHFGTLEQGTVRVSFGCFNTEAECERFVKVLKKFPI